MQFEIAYDPVKNARNIQDRGLPFDRAAEFDFNGATIFRTVRNGEQREIAVGYLDGRLHMLCYVRRAEILRVISFRRVNEQEAKRYGKPVRLD